jgi:hypothetical protein
VDFQPLRGPLQDPLLMFKPPGAPAADFVFRKDPGKPLTVELTVRQGTFTGREGKPLAKQWLGRPTPYWEYHADDSDPPQDFYRLAIPAEAPAGDYRVHVGQEHEGFVFTTSVARYVLAAPEGFCPGQGEKAPWFFQAPGGRIDLVSSNPANLAIKDANGQVLKMENSSDGGQFFTVPAGAADRPLSIQATRYATVKMKGIQPAFAYKSEAALFQPAGLKTVEMLASAGVGDARAQYLPGREGQGLLVNGKDFFAIPVSDQGKPGAVPLDPKQGAIEFYLRPNWDPAFVPLPMNAGLLSVDAEKGDIQASYQRTAVNNQIHSGVAMLACGPPRDGRPRLLRYEAASHVPMRPDRWVHVAYCWHMESGRFIQRLYVDGNFDNSSVMRYFSGGPEAIQHPQGYRQILIACGQPGALNAVIDNVRISRVDRFPKQIWPKPYPVPDKHGDTIDIGGMVIHCHHTPGHTRGTMSFTFEVRIDGETHTAVLWGGPALNTLTSGGYPGNREDFPRTYAYLKTLKADVPLGAHPFVNDTLGKHERLRRGEKPSPFIDPEGSKKFLQKQEADFHKTIAEIQKK